MKLVFSVLLFLVYLTSYSQDTTGVGIILAKLTAIEDTPQGSFIREVEKDTATNADHIWIFTIDTSRLELIKVREQWTNMQVTRRGSVRFLKDTLSIEYYFDRNNLIAVKQSWHKPRSRDSYSFTYYFKNNEAFASDIVGSYGRQNVRVDFLDSKKEIPRRYLEDALGFLKKYSLHSGNN